MKWPVTPVELLSEQTFLVISEDLHAGEEKGNQCDKGDAKPSVQESVGATLCSADTWPKMRKKRQRKMRKAGFENSDGEEARPATASLEKPLVLDPRLVDKLDMSLLKKESLSESLTRITLGLVNNATRMVEITKNESHTERSKPRARFALPVTSNEGRTKISLDSPESDAKRLDDNNNKNKPNSAQQQLSPLRSRSSRTVSSSDVALFTGLGANSKKQRSSPRAPPPEPCQTCGRATQPERLHSHPAKSPPPPSAKDCLTHLGSARSSPSVIPVRATGRGSRKPSARLEQLQQRVPGTVGYGSPKTPGSPVAMASPRIRRETFAVTPGSKTSRTEEKTPRIDEKTSTTEGKTSKTEEKPLRTEEKILKTEEKTLVDEDSKKEKKEHFSERSTPNEEKSAGSTGKRRPRSVTCYICGREFGTASFPIHEPKCLQKWERENKSLPNAQRRQQPVRPIVPMDSEDWNAAAWEQSQALLIPCPKCKRTFLPDRLIVHERNCRIQKGRGDTPISRSPARSSESTRSPRRGLNLVTACHGVGRPYARKLSRIAVRDRSAYTRYKP